MVSLATLGLRPGEVANLHLEDIDWRRGTLYLRTRKTGRGAVLPLPRDAGRAIGDLAAQTEQALINVPIALRAAGATFRERRKTTIYVADWRPERLPALTEGFARAAARLAIQWLRPTTLIGVSCLSHADLLVEFDVTAVLP